MQIFRILLAVAVFSFLPFAGLSAEATNTHAHPTEGTPAQAHVEGHAEHSGLPLYAVPLFQIGAFKVTNSMVVTWIVALALIVFAQIATRNIKRVPEGAQ